MFTWYTKGRKNYGEFIWITRKAIWLSFLREYQLEVSHLNALKKTFRIGLKPAESKEDTVRIVIKGNLCLRENNLSLSFS